jgi:hypothetical protein
MPGKKIMPPTVSKLDLVPGRFIIPPMNFDDDHRFRPGAAAGFKFQPVFSPAARCFAVVINHNPATEPNP